VRTSADESWWTGRECYCVCVTVEVLSSAFVGLQKFSSNVL